MELCCGLGFTFFLRRRLLGEVWAPSVRILRNKWCYCYSRNTRRYATLYGLVLHLGRLGNAVAVVWR